MTDTAVARAPDRAARRQALLDEVLRAEDEVSWITLRTMPPMFAQGAFTWTQLRGLFAIAYRGEATIGQFAELMGVGQPSASVLADRLVRDGLIERKSDTRDRRRTLVTLADRGRALITGMLDIRRSTFERYAAHMSDASLQALADGTLALAAAARAATAIRAAGGCERESAR